jgi:hypothetical protein
VGDVDAKWVFGQVYRRPDDVDESGQSGFRYGHAVESGAYGIIEFENGVRAEIHTGRMHLKGTQLSGLRNLWQRRTAMARR